MTERPAGPFRTWTLDDGTTVPFYMIPFDEDGRCEAPATRAHLVAAARTGGPTHLYFFSHGWNNDWKAAVGHYEHFAAGYLKLRRDRGLAMPAGYRPLLVGVFWPSTALVFGEEEQGPAMAGDDERVATELQLVREIAARLPPDRVERFYDLAQRPGLDAAQSSELAALLSGVCATGADELGATRAPSAEALVRLWREAAAPTGVEESDLSRLDLLGEEWPQAASGILEALDPRQVLRLATVWQMKDRAGRVGANGVAALLRDLLGSCAARTHLIGHSYGVKVLLSATCAAPLPREVESMLLLQGAVSHLCFADTVPGTSRPGGFRPALDRVVQPILATFSRRDFPLHTTFHLALRREEDLGEARIAAAGEPPSPYSALGAVGPRRCGETITRIPEPGETYDRIPATGVVGLDATDAIRGHGDISNEWTWWALYSQVSR